MMTRIVVFLLFSLFTGLFLPVTGISQNASVSGFVWDDLNSNGLQDTLEPGLPGVVVVLENGDSTVATQPTDSLGNYAFTGLPADSFRLEFVNPGGLFLTLQNVGPNDSLDSDADPAGFAMAAPLRNGFVNQLGRGLACDAQRVGGEPVFAGGARADRALRGRRGQDRPRGRHAPLRHRWH